MKQILVPTDLTAHSRPGIRFAIQWSKLQKVRLIFAYVLYTPKLTRWNEEQYKKFAMQEKEKHQKELKRMISGIYRQMSVIDGRYSCEIIDGVITEPSLLDYCRVHPEIDYICMSTHGATGIEKLFGTHAGNIVSQSQIPVVVVPKGYRAKPVKSILYASELRDYGDELKVSAGLAAGFKARLEVLHMVGIGERIPDKQMFEKVLSGQCAYPVQMHFVHVDETRSIATNLRREIQARKPSLAILFTRQDRTVFEKIFVSSASEHLAFRTPSPMMVFAKARSGVSTNDEVHKRG